MFYYYEIKETSDGFIALVPDVGMESLPQATFEDAKGAVLQCFSAYIELEYRKQKQPIPLPMHKIKDGDLYVYVPLKLQLRILLWNEMQRQHIRLVDLAKLLGISRNQAQFFFNAKTTASIEQFERALKALGSYPSLQIK